MLALFVVTAEPGWTLTPAQIHPALGYYYDNREEIDAELVTDRAWGESLR